MLENSRIVYEDRVKDVDRYIGFLERLIDRKPTLVYVSASGERTEETIDPALTHTLKANAFLLLYNLVEATIRSALTTAREQIESAGFAHDDLHDALRKHLTNQLRHDDIRGQVMGSKHPLGRAILWAGFDADKALGGNIDHETISKAARKLGFSVITDAGVTGGGGCLTDVKRNRNQLAHGNKSFLDCGRDTAIEDIVRIKGEVEAYLAQILDNIETWLGSKSYLAKPPGAEPREPAELDL